MQIKKIHIFLFIVVITYFYMLINANRFETLATFPGTEVTTGERLRGFDSTKINFEEINIKDKNGNNINGLYMTGSSEKTVYYFHGNGAPIDYFYNEVKFINSLGYSVMVYDYPGYGKSTGFPYKENVDNFSESFFNYMKKEKNIKNENLIIWGYSLGAAVGVDFASKNDFDKIILFAPFSSRYDMASKMFGFPIQKILFLKNSYNTLESVKKITKPVLIIHGNKDGVIPFSQGKKVFENYLGTNKYFVEVDGGTHHMMTDEFSYSLKNIFSDFIEGNELGFSKLFLDYNLRLKLERENKIKDEEREKIAFLEKIDLLSDSSITKYVSSNISFNNIKYIPDDLININSEYLIDVKGNQTLRKEAFLSLEKMGEAFYKDLGVKLKIISAYRSYDYQVGIKNGGCGDQFCAKAGFSEHQTGLAFDLFEASNEKDFLSNANLKKYFDWLNKNAYKYGFTNSYKNGIEIDTYLNEPWHWRYVGSDFATYLQENNLSFGKYMKNLLLK